MRKYKEAYVEAATKLQVFAFPEGQSTEISVPHNERDIEHVLPLEMAIHSDKGIIQGFEGVQSLALL